MSLYFFGHVADKPPIKNKPSKTFRKAKPDYMAFIQKKGQVNSLDMARRFLMTTQTARVALVELESQGLLRRLPKTDCHVVDVFEIKN